MVKQIVLLSGPVASGKTTLAEQLVDRFGFKLIKTWQLLTELEPDVPRDRESLQALGEKLDSATNGEWVAECLGRFSLRLRDEARIVVDSVRIQEQIDSVRRGFAQFTNVTHLYLDAADEDKVQRYASRRRADIQELDSYESVQKNSTEKNVVKLAQKADVVINTSRCDEGDVLVRAASKLGLYGTGYCRVVDTIVGGQYGSEGKGQVAAHLAKEYDLLIRVGGPNAGHKVYRRDKPDTFHILPSGSRVPGTQLMLGAGAVVNVSKLLEEIASLEVTPDRLTIDPQVMVINEQDVERENGLVKAIGSTGQGVGEATARRILQRQGSSVQLARDILSLRPYVRPAWEKLEVVLRDPRSRVLLEGTQGTSLSLYHGPYPHVTSRDTTVSGCLAEAGIAPGYLRRSVMVTRTYPIRVQSPKGKTSGPMKGEISKRAVAERSGLLEIDIAKTETTSTTNKPRRIGEFDFEQFKKSVFLNSPTDIALTFVDYLDDANRAARRFEQLTPETLQFIEELELIANTPVSLVSTRFHYRSIIDRRHW